MIRYKDIFNQNTLNIFTDASIVRKPNETVGAPGYVAVVGEEIINEDIRILRESTNNESEIYAIYMAIQFALKYKDYVKIINIFSDSQFAIYGLREWIFSWINNIKDDKLYSSTNKEVSHQSIFMAIVYTILTYDLKVSFFHNRGHFENKHVDLFIDQFTKHNFLRDNIDRETAKAIIYYNNKIDNDTRSQLYCIKTYPNYKLIMPQYLARNDLDMDHYKELLNI